MLSTLVTDPQDGVVVAATESLVSQVLAKGFFNGFVLPILTRVFGSASWRVRYTIACRLGSILAGVYLKHRSRILELISTLLRDSELEVCIKTIESLKDAADLFDSEEISEHILPAVGALLDHEEHETRVAMARSLPYLAKSVGSNHLNDFTNIMIRLLKDENPEVRMCVLANLDPLTKSVSFNQIYKILNEVLVELLNDKSWIIRRDAIASLEILSLKLGEDFASNERILEAFKNKLCDRIYQIRNNTVCLLQSLGKFFGVEFAEQKVLPLFRTFATHKNYLYRLNYPQGLQAIAPLLTHSSIHAELPAILEICKDPVPNVRYQGLKTLVCLNNCKDDPKIDQALQ